MFEMLLPFERVIISVCLYVLWFFLYQVCRIVAENSRYHWVGGYVCLRARLDASKREEFVDPPGNRTQSVSRTDPHVIIPTELSSFILSYTLSEMTCCTQKLYSVQWMVQIGVYSREGKKQRSGTEETESHVSLHTTESFSWIPYVNLALVSCI
jgi:hypothetical protein